MRIAIDAMGGDHAPKEIVLGAMKAIEHFDQLHLTLIGDENAMKPYLKSNNRVDIIHTTEKITSEDEPVKAVRRKKNASMVLMANEVKTGRADACISAGNTGALMSAGLFIVGRIKGIDRPALSPTLPTVDGDGFLLLDVGANVDAKPQHLQQYALMGSIYMEKVRQVEKPRVGLLNVGTEKGKGNDLTKKAFDLMQDLPIQFVGNVEARDLLNGVADVVVTDGFSGNIALKTVEGTALTMFSMIKEVFTTNTKTKLAALLAKNDMKGIKSKLDYSEYGGAALFGLAAPVVKAHGSSNQQAIFSAIQQTVQIVEKEVITKIEAEVQQLQANNEEE
ncbi:phosphate acyltransferase PlsX [Gracilibacillus caseinilyticus]|uniref:Phosphate acyltransferase n=1 Tax=Gracilibacillus caseinilyticus TaxID=2932256 RepID=A0ABY4EV18_9BACI|nr:phosphate acyltransferase PlsX [Gracilibacillus caseinilyticus]UOQ47911.1 phosphate acyltransferase PlsX [Gracilibacillus caseinilyticus]